MTEDAETGRVEYDKLVRDEIPEIIEDNGEVPEIHVADDAEYRRRLHEKLDEEVAEFHDSGDPDELADVLEVVFALGSLDGLSERDLQQRREQKAAERGRFDDRVVLEETRNRER